MCSVNGELGEQTLVSEFNFHKVAHTSSLVLNKTKLRKLQLKRGALSVTVIVLGNGIDNQRSNPGARGCQRLHLLCKPYRQRRPRRLWSAAYPWLDSRFSVLCLNLTAWLSRGFLPVTHLLDLTAPTRCHPPVH